MSDKSIKIDADLHQAVKVRAAEKGGSITEWINDAIREKLSEEDPIEDAFAIWPFLRVVYDQVSPGGTSPSDIKKELSSQYPKENIQNTLDKLRDLGAIKEIALPNPPPIGDQVVYRKIKKIGDET
jgi:plasmid stability protein